MRIERKESLYNAKQVQTLLESIAVKGHDKVVNYSSRIYANDGTVDILVEVSGEDSGYSYVQAVRFNQKDIESLVLDKFKEDGMDVKSAYSWIQDLDKKEFMGVKFLWELKENKCLDQ